MDADVVQDAHSVDKPFGDVHSAVKDVLPAVRLVSVVQGWAYLEHFDLGIEAYSALPSPSPDDDRWLGVCYFKLFQDAKALDALRQAASRGLIAAKVNLALLLRYMDRVEDSTKELEEVDPAQLSKYDQVLYFRVLSIHEETSGNIRVALQHAEEAWKRVQGIPEYSLLAPSVLAQLGVLYARYGRAQRALWYLERGIQATVGIEQQKVRLKRAIVLTTLGRYSEAQVELDGIPRASGGERFDAERLLLSADVAWSLNEIDRAIALYEDTIRVAVRDEVTYEEFLSRLPLVAIEAHQSRYDRASQHLERAQELISDRADRLNYRFREVLLHYWRGSYSGSQALEEFDRISHEFNDMGLLQEMGAVKLHRIDVQRRLGQPLLHALDDLQALSVTLQNHAFLAREWALLPELRKVARRSHAVLAGHSPAVLKLRTLGFEHLEFTGQVVSIPLKRSVELLAYFLEHKTVSLRQLLHDVFPEEKPRSAKSYFHQFRHQLKELVDGVEIEYDRESRLYMLKSEIDILWDVAELRAGRGSGEVGPFLPSSNSDWALALDHSLERYRD